MPGKKRQVKPATTKRSLERVKQPSVAEAEAAFKRGLIVRGEAVPLKKGAAAQDLPPGVTHVIDKRAPSFANECRFVSGAGAAAGPRRQR